MLKVFFAVFFISVAALAQGRPASAPRSPAPPQAPYSIRPNQTPHPVVPDDEGAEDDEEVVTEAGVPCLSPACLGIGVLPPLTLRNPNLNEVDTVNAALVQAAFQSYSNSSPVERLISSARNHIRLNPNRYIERKRGRKKKTFCYRAVKDALRAADMVSDNFYGSAVARSGVKDLESAGFHDLLKDPNFSNILKNRPEMAPKGAILVYETAPPARASIAGHIEIKTADAGSDGYISVSETLRPTYGYPIPQVRRLIGVMIKE